MTWVFLFHMHARLKFIGLPKLTQRNACLFSGDFDTPRTRRLPTGEIERVPERERHACDLSRLGERHPLHPIIVACIRDSPQARISAEGLCERLSALKLSPVFQLFPSTGHVEGINAAAMSGAGAFAQAEDVRGRTFHELEAVSQAMQLVPPEADVQHPGCRQRKSRER